MTREKAVDKEPEAEESFLSVITRLAIFPEDNVLVYAISSFLSVAVGSNGVWEGWCLICGFTFELEEHLPFCSG